MVRKTKKMLFVHPKMREHYPVLLPLELQPLWSQYTLRVRYFICCRRPKKLPSNIFSSEIAPYNHNPPFTELIFIFFFLFSLISSILSWLCLCFHFRVLSILLHSEFSFYLLKVRATVHIFRIHGGVCGYRY